MVVNRDTADFFRALYGEEAFEGGHFYLWIKGKSKKTIWCETIKEAAERAAAESGKANVYFGVGLAAERKSASERATADDVASIPGVWVDIDYLAPHHKKSNLPPTSEEALGLIDSAPFAPSIVVDSGGGYHAYWRFKEPLEIASGEDRERAAALVAGWQGIIRATAKARGWEVDATHDLARVLRVPGTLNINAEPPADCFVHGIMGHEYNPEDLEEMLPADDEEAREFERFDPRAFGVVPRSGSVPPDYILTLCSERQSFGMTWNKTRDDLGDDSASAWDMSLATQFAILDGEAEGDVPTIQEIADLITEYRAKHFAPGTPGYEKGFRPDYLARTASRAIFSARRILAERAARGGGQAPAAPGPAVPTPGGEPGPKGGGGDEASKAEEYLDPTDPKSVAEGIEKDKKDLASALGCNIIRVVRFENADPVTVEMEVEVLATGKRRRVVFEPRHMTKAAAFKERWWEACEVLPACAAGTGWNQRTFEATILDKFWRIWENINVSDDETEPGVVFGYLRDYIVDHKGVTDDLESAWKAKAPFWKSPGEEAYFFLDDFCAWMVSRDPSLSRKMNVSRILRRVPLSRAPGCSEGVVRRVVRIPVSPTASKTVGVYPIPAEILHESRLSGYRPRHDTRYQPEGSCFETPFDSRAVN